MSVDVAGEEERMGTYVFALCFALQVGLDGFVLFVELCQVWNEVLDDVGVG